jgi:hypothetical protein
MRQEPPSPPMIALSMAKVSPRMKLLLLLSLALPPRQWLT